MEGPGVLSIQEFLLARTAGVGDERLHTEVGRHDERSMTVVFRDRVEVITRCGVCPKEETRPCTVLRVLALPYAGHPDYCSAWGLTAPEDVVAPLRDSLPALTDALVARTLESVAPD